MQDIEDEIRNVDNSIDNLQQWAQQKEVLVKSYEEQLQDLTKYKNNVKDYLQNEIENAKKLKEANIDLLATLKIISDQLTTLFKKEKNPFIQLYKFYNKKLDDRIKNLTYSIDTYEQDLSIKTNIKLIKDDLKNLLRLNKGLLIKNENMIKDLLEKREQLVKVLIYLEKNR